MAHVLPPKPTGVLTAIDAAPTAAVAFVGHIGLEQFSSIIDVWRGMPMDSSIVTRVWLIQAADIPPPPEREQWLYDCWARMDAWIAATMAEGSDGR